MPGGNWFFASGLVAHTSLVQDHRDLRVFRKAHIHVLRTRKTIKRFPNGYSTLKHQLIKSVESIPFNIVEGCAAQTRKEFARFLDISIKSTSEAEYQLQLAKDYGILLPKLWTKLHNKNADIRRMLWGLRKTVLEADERDTRNDKTENARRVTGPSRDRKRKRKIQGD